MKKIYIFYPFLLAVFPLLSFYNHNRHELVLRVIFLPLTVIILLSIVCYFAVISFLKNKIKARIVTSLLIFMFFSYGHLVKLLEKSNLVDDQIIESSYLISVWLLIFSLIILLIIKSKKNHALLSEILKITSIILVIIPVFQIGYFEFNKKSWKPLAENMIGKLQLSTDFCSSETCRDVYYIIVEKYASNNVLKEHFNYDNSDFTAFLERQGFYVAENSRSNYLITPLSLASSLNMDYLHELAQYMGEDSPDRRPIYKMITDYKAWRYLKSKGYKFIHIGPYWDVSTYNKFADINYKYKALSLSEFSRLFLETTILFPIMNKIHVVNYLEERTRHYNFSLDQIDKLIEYSQRKGPKYVFAHLYITHDPYVFDKGGEFVTEMQGKEHGYKNNYVNTLVFANTKLKNLIEKILSNSEKEPIIILQADEGPRSERFFQDTSILWKYSTKEEFRVKTGILSAYYLPSIDEAIIYPSITPVNTFRLIFNHYFGENYTLLPDQVFAHQDYHHPYALWEITQLLQ